MNTDALAVRHFHPRQPEVGAAVRSVACPAGGPAGGPVVGAVVGSAVGSVAGRVIRSSAAAKTRISALLLVATAFGCSDGTVQAASTPPPRTTPTAHYVAILDRSTSVTPTEIEAFRRSIDGVVQSLSYGDRFSMFVAYAEGRRTGTGQITRGMPDARNPNLPLQDERRALESARESLRRATGALFESPATEWTDLVSSLSTAEEHFRRSDADQRILLLYSDMLHCAKGEQALCMESASWTADPDRFVRAVPVEGASGLSGVCVWVIGADASTAAGARVQHFWVQVFDRLGAQLSDRRYYYGIPDPPDRRCV